MALIKNPDDFGLTDDQLGMFELFKENLLDWNQRMNLTAITDDDSIWQKHFADSLTLLPFLPPLPDSPSSFVNSPIRMIDVGSGAGFPGLPIKIVRPDISMVLLDSLRKRLVFLEDTIAKLRITDIKCIHARAEDLSKKPEHRHGYDIVTARAVARLDKLVKWCFPFVKPGGRFLAMKGPNVNDEVDEALPVIKRLRGEVVDIKYMEIMQGMVHSVVVVCYNGY